MYAIAQALVSFAADIDEAMLPNLVHEPPVGCMFDAALNKHSIKLGMVAGNMCPACQMKLRQLGTPEAAMDAVERILTRIRFEALGRAPVFDPSNVFVAMRFSQNDENDNAWQYGIRPGLGELNLRADRLDTTLVSAQILESVIRGIKRSRFVLAKVDDQNLNVYFELGLSMGLEKEVLLVCESTLMMQLPSDLRNWAVLTYKKGDYRELKQRIMEYYRGNYGL